MLKWLQDNVLNNLMAIAAMAGDKVILTGVDDVGPSTTNGWISYNGELLPFVGGTTGTDIVIDNATTLFSLNGLQGSVRLVIFLIAI
jgi:hypothetical protein